MAESKVVVITGASSGIGATTAEVLAAQGNRVVMAARRAARLQELKDKITAKGGACVTFGCDVTRIEQVEALAQFALDSYGTIDVWVNNAGLMPLSEFAKDHVSEWEAMVDTNLKGVLYGVHAALPIFRQRGSGQFVNVGSVSSHVPTPAGGVYAATKFGVRALSESLRQEEAAAGSKVRVTLIAPGAIDTELTTHVTDPEQAAGMAEFYRSTAIPARSVADAIAFAINMPEHTSINEILLRPTAQVL